MRKGTLGVVLAAALALSVADASAAPYSFTNIADSSGPFRFSFVFATSLNNSGEVAFMAELDTGAGAIFASGGGRTTILYDDTSGRFSDIGRSVSLNDKGTVAFHALQDTGMGGIFTGSGGPTTTIFRGHNPLLNGFGTVPALNDNGTVSFYGGGFGRTGIFTGNGGAITTIADNSGPFFAFGEPSINNSGAVAFSAFLDTFEEVILRQGGGPTTTIADDSGPFHAFHGFGAPSLSNSGTVAFHAVLDTEEQGIFIGSGGSTTTVVDTSGPFSFFGASALNERGTVAFHGSLDTGGSGIYTGPDSSADEVIGAGDKLFGSAVREFHGLALNDTSQIAFSYILADGRTGIALADPLAIPEPGTLSLLVAALLSAMFRRRGKSSAGRSLSAAGHAWRARDMEAHDAR